jgi:hypothetical protein
MNLFIGFETINKIYCCKTVIGIFSGISFSFSIVISACVSLPICLPPNPFAFNISVLGYTGSKKLLPSFFSIVSASISG